MSCLWDNPSQNSLIVFLFCTKKKKTISLVPLRNDSSTAASPAALEAPETHLTNSGSLVLKEPDHTKLKCPQCFNRGLFIDFMSENIKTLTLSPICSDVRVTGNRGNNRVSEKLIVKYRDISWFSYQFNLQSIFSKWKLNRGARVRVVVSDAVWQCQHSLFSSFYSTHTSLRKHRWIKVHQRKKGLG